MTRKIFMVAALAGMGMFVTASTAWASGEGECSGGACGTPQTSGGGCGCGGGGSILINNTDEGDTYQYADDYDEDGREDDVDNCPFISNKAQSDGDGDGVGDACDNCPAVGNRDLLDTDADGMGDACDEDIDNDSVLNRDDLCPLVPNPKVALEGIMKQIDTDGDGIGDACDPDDDNDKVLDVIDNCPLVHNPLQENADPNSFGNACDNDQDKDNIDDSKDNCITVPNRDQLDLDGDKLGDACDPDVDNDKVPNQMDNCKLIPNADQMDSDRDGKGEACDARFCYVVSGDEAHCLDPKMTFQVFSPGGRVKTGEPVRLRLFANRTNAAIRYKWIVEGRPDGSNATVENPQGTVRMSTPFEYHYIKENVASFTADEPGEYKVKIIGTLVFPDTVNANWDKTYTYVMSITAEGDSMGGCSVAGTRSNLPLAFVLVSLLGLAIVGRRR
jgi:hypothetical protein